jgi:tetratricopeptide (TPR) repeat protein
MTRSSSPFIARHRSVSLFRLFVGGSVLLLIACAGAAADHEMLGDRAYAARHFTDALVEYRLALKQGATGRLRAKAGAAALHAGDFVAAADEYGQLGVEGKGPRATEAADGLERVARAAVAADDRLGLAAALNNLRKVAPGRALGSLAFQLAQSLGSEPHGAEALNVLPSAAAGAPDAGRQDSLMFVYASTLSRAGRCDQAMPIFEAVARRQREPSVVQPAARSLDRCALMLGRQALDAGQPEQAEEWFREAASGADEKDPVARAAYIGLGDVLFARGALAEAAEAYQRALTGAEPGDSLGQVAAQKLNLVANAGTVIH